MKRTIVVLAVAGSLAIAGTVMARGGGGGGGHGGGGWHGGGGGWHGGGGGWHGGGGGWHGGGGGWHGSVGIYLGPGYWGWPYYGSYGYYPYPYGYSYSYAYPYPYAYPYAYGYSYPSGPYVAAPATDYVERGSDSAAAPPVTWYYCTDPAGYYPYVPRCNQPWHRVAPQDVPAPPPSGSSPK
jgi:hypothetical protein